MKKLVDVLKAVFLITDTLISSICYVIIVLVITIFVWLGIAGLAVKHNTGFIWDLSVFAFTFFSLFHFFIKKDKYSFNEYVIATVPFSALLLIMSMAFLFMHSQNNDSSFETISEIMMHMGIVLLSFALTHTSVLVIRNKINTKH